MANPTTRPRMVCLLRADLHLLFDAGLMTVNADTRRVMLDPMLRKAVRATRSFMTNRCAACSAGIGRPAVTHSADRVGCGPRPRT
jgi:hypothetical protein